METSSKNVLQNIVIEHMNHTHHYNCVILILVLYTVISITFHFAATIQTTCLFEDSKKLTKTCFY